MSCDAPFAEETHENFKFQRRQKVFLQIKNEKNSSAGLFFIGGRGRSPTSFFNWPKHGPFSKQKKSYCTLAVNNHDTHANTVHS